jgi:hypothetical protein
MAMMNFTIRFSREELAVVKAATQRIGKKKPWRRDYTVAEFIRECISERLDHLARSETAHKKRRVQKVDAKDLVIEGGRKIKILANEGTGTPFDTEGVE